MVAANKLEVALKVKYVDFQHLKASDIDVAALSDPKTFSDLAQSVGQQLVQVFASQLDAIEPPSRPYGLGESRAHFARLIRDCNKRQVPVSLTLRKGKGICLVTSDESGQRLVPIHHFMRYLLDKDHGSLWTEEWQRRYETVLAGFYYQDVHLGYQVEKIRLQNFFGSSDLVQALSGVVLTNHLS